MVTRQAPASKSDLNLGYGLPIDRVWLILQGMPRSGWGEVTLYSTVSTRSTGYH
jgi:hypothetical protein